MDSNSVSRRKFIGVAGGVAAGAAIAGPASAATKKPAAKKPAAKKPAAKPAAINKPGSGVVNYWNHFTSPVERSGFEQVTDGFKKDFPAIDLKVEAIQNQDWMTKYITAVQAKSGPDAIMVTASRIADMVRIGGLASLQVRSDAWPTLKSNNAEGAVKGMQYLGQQYALPCFIFIDWMYYRKDFFAAKGIKEAPKTLEEFRLAAIELTDPSKGRYGFALRGGSGGWGFMPKLMTAYNGPIVTNGKCTLELDNAIDALRFWVGLVTKDKVVPPSVLSNGYGQIMTSFKTGETAMLWHHTGSFVEIGAALKYGVEVATAIQPKGPKLTAGLTSPLGNGIFKGSSNPDGAWDFITYWGDTKAQLAFLKATGYFGAAKPVFKDAAVTGQPAYAPALQGLQENWNDYTFPGYDNWMTNTCLPEFQKAAGGKQTPEQAARAIWTELREVTGTK